MAKSKDCKQCAFMITDPKTGKKRRCKNKISCHKSCVKYCWLHSKARGLYGSQNTVCTKRK